MKITKCSNSSRIYNFSMKIGLWFPHSDVYKKHVRKFSWIGGKKNVKRTGIYILQKPGALHFVRYLRIQEKRRIFIAKEMTCGKFHWKVVNTAWIGAPRIFTFWTKDLVFTKKQFSVKKIHPSFFHFLPQS